MAFDRKAPFIDILTRQINRENKKIINQERICRFQDMDNSKQVGGQDRKSDLIDIIVTHGSESHAREQVVAEKRRPTPAPQLPPPPPPPPQPETELIVSDTPAAPPPPPPPVTQMSQEQAIQDALVVLKSDEGYVPAPATSASNEQAYARELETIMLPMGHHVHPEYHQAITGTSGFVYTLQAATSGMIRRGEDPLTYLNKDQFYPLILEYSGGGFRSESAVSVVSVQFREKEKQSTIKDAVLHWHLWMSKQQSSKLRVIETEHAANTGVLSRVEDVAHNAVKVHWNPHAGPAHVSLGVKCLSTDFSNQKGVKGIPLHIQIDTYAMEDKNREVVLDRAFCQIKTFCDKGAERKQREEERRLQRQPPTYACQPTQPRSLFVRSVNGEFNREAVLFNPDANQMKAFPSPARSSPASAGRRTPLDFKPSPIRRAPRPKPPTVTTAASAIMMYVRQENEEVFTPVSVSPAGVKAFVVSISSKYQISCRDVRRVYKKFVGGIVVWVDDDMVKTFHGGSFLMKVLATEVTVQSERAPVIDKRLLFDIVLIEDNNNNPCLPGASL